MKVARVGTGYIVFMWGLVIVLLGTVLYMGYRRNSADLVQVMENEAKRLIEVVAISATAGIHALDEVEYLTAERLLDNARLIERISRKHTPSPETLTEITRENDLHMINILEKDGVSVSRAVELSGTGNGTRSSHLPEVESVLSGETDEAAIGFMDGRYYSGKHYGVVVRRRSGGAVMVNADSDRMLEFRRVLGLGTVFKEIGLREGVRYIVLQDTLGIIAASGGVQEMTRISDDPFLLDALNSEWKSRIIRDEGEGILEVVNQLIVDNVNLGLLRIGLSTATIDSIRKRAIKQFIFLFIAAMLSGVFVLGYVMLRQNYMILDAAHDRILREVREMEEEARRTERLTSMGRLAAGVAHEIRNPLNAISIITQRLKAEFRPVEDEKGYQSVLSTVGKEIARISTIIEDFLKYARPPELKLAPISLKSIVSEVLDIIGEKARVHNMTVEVEIQPGLVCWCDKEQMKQALLNILLNALDAVQENGTISIEAEKSKNTIILRIQDTGSGIPDDVLPNIFDPYFTTRDGGTGLGLSEVHRIVTAHGGRIWAENADTGGAVFTVSLPIVREKRVKG